MQWKKITQKVHDALVAQNFDHFEFGHAEAKALCLHIGELIGKRVQFAVTPTDSGWTISSINPMEDQPMPEPPPERAVA